VHAAVQTRIKVQVRVCIRWGLLPRERDREHMQVVEARTVLVPQRVGPADVRELAARRAARGAVLAMPETLGEFSGIRLCPARVRVRQVERQRRPLRLVLRWHRQIVRGVGRRRATPESVDTPLAPSAGSLARIGEDHANAARVGLGVVGSGNFSGHESSLSCTLSSVPVLSHVHVAPKLSIVSSELAFGLCDERGQTCWCSV
jgi:hypothetical protein